MSVTGARPPFSLFSTGYGVSCWFNVGWLGDAHAMRQMANMLMAITAVAAGDPPALLIRLTVERRS